MPSDDLVARLRRLIAPGSGVRKLLRYDLREAADEIERLRTIHADCLQIDAARGEAVDALQRVLALADRYDAEEREAGDDATWGSEAVADAIRGAVKGETQNG